MFSDRKERMGLVIASIIFAVGGLVQLWRAFGQVPVTFGATVVPIWLSFIVGVIALGMAFWLFSILRHHRPLV